MQLYRFFSLITYSFYLLWLPSILCIYGVESSLVESLIKPEEVVLSIKESPTPEYKTVVQGFCKTTNLVIPKDLQVIIMKYYQQPPKKNKYVLRCCKEKNNSRITGCRRLNRKCCICCLCCSLIISIVVSVLGFYTYCLTTTHIDSTSCKFFSQNDNVPTD